MFSEKRFACNRFYLSASEPVLQNTVVVINGSGCYQRHFPLTFEQPAVAWLGGIFFLLPEGVSPRGHACDFWEWYAKLLPVFQKEQVYMLWRILHTASDAEQLPQKASFVRLV